MSPPLWKGPLPALNVQRHYLWKSFRTKSNTIPGLPEKCSASARNPVRLHPGIVFDINPERCSASPRNPVRLGPESPSRIWRRFHEAAAELEAAKSVDRYGDVHFQLAAALKKLGREEEAAAALRESARLREKEHAREQKLARISHRP